MKKILILCFLCMSVVLNAQSFKRDYAKKEFKDSVRLDKHFQFGTVVITTTGAELNYVHNVTSAIQTQFTGKVNVSDTASMIIRYARLLNPVFLGTVSAPVFKPTYGDTTVTAVKGLIVFKTSDSTAYVCRGTHTNHRRWFPMNAYGF